MLLAKNINLEGNVEIWQLHRLFETDDAGEERQIGGAITRMDIGAVNGSLHEINVRPVPVEEMKEELWDGNFVRLQVADRVVWMEPEEIETLIDLFMLAYDTSKKNYEWLRSKNLLDSINPPMH